MFAVAWKTFMVRVQVETKEPSTPTTPRTPSKPRRASSSSSVDGAMSWYFYKLSREAVYYTAAFLLTWGCKTYYLASRTLVPEKLVPPVWVFLYAWFVPSQGFFNALVYFFVHDRAWTRRWLAIKMGRPQPREFKGQQPQCHFRNSGDPSMVMPPQEPSLENSDAIHNSDATPDVTPEAPKEQRRGRTRSRDGLVRTSFNFF